MPLDVYPPMLLNEQWFPEVTKTAGRSRCAPGRQARRPRHPFHEAVLPSKLEGLVAKRADSIYRPGVRSAEWVKVKRKGAGPPERFKRK